MIQLQTDYIRLIHQLGFDDIPQITHLPGSGSPRQYFRFSIPDTSLIGVVNENTEENEAFFSMADGLKSVGISVPEVMVISDDRKFYLQTDLGDQRLFDVLLQYKDKPYDDYVIGLLKDTVIQLANIQFKAGSTIDFERSWPTGHHNFKTILDDLYYFKYYFLKVAPSLSFNEYRLDNEFVAFANKLLEAPSEFFMYRDFQSRNIMIHQNKLWFIDFQGARKGPLQYDLVSLLYQARANIPQPIREQLIEVYINELAKHSDPKKLKFRDYLPYFIYFRLFQVMGAYGFRGLIQKRPHFLESIPYAIQLLGNLLNNNSLQSEFPYLHEVLHRLTLLEGFHPSMEHTAQKLHINLSSFSFKKGGIPADFSGNGGGHVFDCRMLPNPGREAKYAFSTGKDQDVIDFFMHHTEMDDFFENVQRILKLSIDNYTQRKFKHLMVSFGCTGGQHRSVYMAEKTYQWIQANYPEVLVSLKHHEL